MDKISTERIEKSIYHIRGLRVMLDSDLADLYEVETKQLNRQVRRNAERFPDDFMFQLNSEETENLRCQIGTSSLDHGGARYLPMVFTENGVAMLASVLRSSKAIQVNIAIMRIFTHLRSFLMLEQELRQDLNQMKNDTSKMFKIVFERLDSIEEPSVDSLPLKRKKIGLK